MVHVDGWEHLEWALAQGRGVVFFSAHFGNTDIVMQVAAARGLQATSPVERTRPEHLFQYARNLRESHGMKLIPADGLMLGLYRALKRGELVGLAADRDVTNSGRIVEFFGAPTRLPDGPIRVALHTGAPLLPAFALRLPDNSFRLEIEAPLELTRTGDEEAAIQSGIERVVEIMERHIAKNPEQWLVAQPVWPVN
jgi:KDO2-lipid IV(A) lauroyltransferase